MTARAKVRKEDLVRQAELLFAERGYAQTRMTDIAQAAGVTKGLVYWYFESKDALIAEILVDIREQLRNAQREATAAVEEPLAKVYVGTVASVRFVLERYRLFEVNVTPTRELRMISGESAVVHAADTAETLREGQERGTVRADDPAHVLAHGNAGVVNQFCVGYNAGRIEGTVDDVAHMAAKFLVRGLAADGPIAEQVIATYGR